MISYRDRQSLRSLSTSVPIHCLVLRKMKPSRDRNRAAGLIRSLTFFGDWWTALILREAFSGTRHFAVFHDRLGIPRQTLTNRLREMVANGIFQARPYLSRPVRYEYRLTSKGLGLYGYALMCWAWNRKWGDPADRTLPRRLIHRSCGNAMGLRLACGHCHQDVDLESLSWNDGPGMNDAGEEGPTRSKRLTVSRDIAANNTHYQHGAFVMTDRWLHAILIWAFRGRSTFDVFERELGISPSTLANRLQHLVEARLLERLSDPTDARRVRYVLAERGRDLLPISLMLSQWADEWTPGPKGPAMTIRHLDGDHPLSAIALCDACGQAPHWRDVELDWGPKGRRTA